jgi:hypothetical protein
VCASRTSRRKGRSKSTETCFGSDITPDTDAALGKGERVGHGDPLEAARVQALGEGREVDALVDELVAPCPALLEVLGDGGAQIGGHFPASGQRRARTASAATSTRA